MLAECGNPLPPHTRLQHKWLKSLGMEQLHVDNYSSGVYKQIYIYKNIGGI